MLLHLCPRLFWRYRDPVALVDLTIPALDVRLLGGVDLMIGRPYPNKAYFVACSVNARRKAYDGVLLELASLPDEFEVIVRWAANAELLSTHRVLYRVLEREFDTFTESMSLWYATSASLADWPDRRPATMKDYSPAQAQPVMELAINNDVLPRPNTSDTLDNTTGMIAERFQRFALPSVERERLASHCASDRYPSQIITIAKTRPANGYEVKPFIVARRPRRRFKPSGGDGYDNEIPF